MSRRTNQEYLKNDQYADAGNLNARIELHQRFSTNPEDWFRWVFDQLELTGNEIILELGCGPGMLWKQNLDRLSPGGSIFLSDLSFGMVQEARRNTQLANRPILFTQLDTQSVPCPTAYFDLVIANHMLYHIPDRQKAISDIHRVLKPGGTLIAATNGIDHLIEIRQILIQFDPSFYNKSYHAFGVNEFTIENGTDQLVPWFEKVNTVSYNDSLEITEAEPLIKYILSMNVGTDIEIYSEKLPTLTHYINQKISEDGVLHITKSTALFLAHKRRKSNR